MQAPASFSITAAHVGHVLDIAPWLHRPEPDPAAIGFAMEDVMRSHAWAILAGRQVLCIFGVIRQDRSPWAIVVPVLDRHAEDFTVGAFALLSTVRATLPGFPAPVPTTPRAARDWLMRVATRPFQAPPQPWER